MNHRFLTPTHHDSKRRTFLWQRIPLVRRGILWMRRMFRWRRNSLTRRTSLSNRNFLRRRIVFWVGSLLSLAAVVMLGRIPFFYFRSAVVGSKLLQSANALVNKNSSGSSGVNSLANNRAGSSIEGVMESSANGTDAANAATNSTISQAYSVQTMSAQLQVPTVQTGHIIGEVVIPALSLTAPLLQGTNAYQLQAAVGHLITSVMPGKPGTTLIAAHNATWFRHIDRLKPGDSIQVKTVYGVFRFEVTSSRVVKTGAAVPNTLESSVILESCYPLNALYLTPYRFLVYGKLVQITSTHVVPTKATSGTNYGVTIPQQIVNEGLTLSANTLPMGLLTYTGTPSNSFTQSNSPWSATHAMIELYLAWVHASGDKNVAAINAIAPRAAVDPFFGVRLRDIEYLSNYDVSLHVEGNQLLSATSSVQVRIKGKPYTVMLTADTYGHQMKLTRVEVK
jgi:sortase A